MKVYERVNYVVASQQQYTQHLGIAETETPQVTVNSTTVPIAYFIFAPEITNSTLCTLGNLSDEQVWDSLAIRKYGLYTSNTEPDTIKMESSIDNANLILFFSKPLGNMLMAELYRMKHQSRGYEDYTQSNAVKLLFCFGKDGEIEKMFTTMTTATSRNQ